MESSLPPERYTCISSRPWTERKGRSLMRIMQPMKLLVLCCIVGLLHTTQRVGAEPVPVTLRQVVSMNREWKFQLGDVPGAEAVSYSDSNWESVGIPHSFSIPYFGASKFYVGYGWYRKCFEVPQTWSGKRISMEFDGAFQVAEVFVNGRRVGEHKGGYTGFTFDITDAVHPGGNTLAIRVNNLWNARLAPRAGEHVFSGGIYRNVRLLATAPLHVAWYGTFVTTPTVSKESGTVNVKTEIVNDSDFPKQATVRTELVDADGAKVARMESTQMLTPHATLVFDQTSHPVLHPKLWSPEQPNLYSVKTTVLEKGKAVDDFSSPLGFRTVRFSADEGFFLNGEHRYLIGANVHQDHAGWGDAVADSGFFRDVRMVKDAGFDFIRGSHYPHAPAFVEACDTLGVMFWSENCFWGTGGFKSDGAWKSSAYPGNPADQPGFEESVKQQLREMIRIHRNHPSVIVWSMGNEAFFSEKELLPKVKTFLAELVALSHECDPTRPAAIGGTQRPVDDNRIDRIGDVAGYNGDGARLPVFQNPGVPNLVSEYGSTTAVRPGKFAPGWGDLAKDGGKPTYSWRSGQAIWCMFDHGSIAGDALGRMGIVDYFRIPKRAWYWYRNEYRKVPPPRWPENGVPAAIRLSADKPVLKGVDGRDDAQIFLTVVDSSGTPLSNSPAVTLAIESGPGEFPTGTSIVFEPNADIAIRDGQAAIEFRSYFSGTTVIRATSPGMKDGVLTMVSQGKPAFVQGVTPPVAPRRYVRFNGDSANQGNATVPIGFQNPTGSSSETAGHGSAFANDGNAETFWQAADVDPASWWQMDMEKTVQIKDVKLTFPRRDSWRYRVEVSDNGQDGWKLVADETEVKRAEITRTSHAAPGVRGRFLRVSFANGSPAAISEIEVMGILLTN